MEKKKGNNKLNKGSSPPEREKEREKKENKLSGSKQGTSINRCWNKGEKKRDFLHHFEFIFGFLPSPPRVPTYNSDNRTCRWWFSLGWEGSQEEERRGKGEQGEKPSPQVFLVVLVLGWPSQQFLSPVELFGHWFSGSETTKES